IKAIADFGLFISIGEEVDALIHVSDISWTRKNINLEEEFKVGTKVSGIVLTVDKENEKFSLGLKQLEEDPWKKIEERIPVGNIVEGPIVRITDFGAFVELETGIEGLVHISELSEERVEKVTDLLKRGDTCKAMVISIDKEAKKISLSIKALGKAEEIENVKAHKKEDTKNATLANKLKGFNVASDE
ncbi:MAG: S1 RNA-binding domain-containing protein, partial [Bacteriovoracaceae bacterium]|nr:S1 RNA-binding domain-containing protein [Bacteriovoracaceae bacterium]